MNANRRPIAPDARALYPSVLTQIAVALFMAGLLLRPAVRTLAMESAPDLLILATENEVRLSAEVLSAAHVRLLERALEVDGPGRRVVIESRINAERSTDWMLTSELAARIAALLETGELRINGRAVRISGTTAWPEDQASLVSRLRSVARPETTIEYAVTAISVEQQTLEALCRRQFYHLTRGQRLDFGNIAATPGSGSQSILDGLAELMSDCPELQVTVTGHTDALGGPDINQRVSLDRANAVVNYLVSLGLSPGRFSATGAGASDPIVPQDDVSAGRINRRVEFALR